MAVAASPSRITPFGLLGDDRLVRLAAAGHERAFAVVYERHHQALYRYCRSILRNDADAQDALQSTFTAAFAALGRGGPDAPIRPWLFRIAHNEAVSALRRRRPTVGLSDATDYQTISVEDQVADRARLDLLLCDLRELHDRQRSALVMRELSGLSHEEIALALETSVGAAKQAIYEARRSLFEFVEGRAMSCDEIRRTISDADGRLLRSRRVRAHLRECSACAGFAAAISTREHELRALVPALPAAAAAGLLVRAAGAGSAHGAGSSLTGLAVGAAGKTGGAALAANALAGVAVVASATVGVTFGVDQLTQGTQAGAGRHGTPAGRSMAAPHRKPAFAVSPAAGAATRRAQAAQLHQLTKSSAVAHPRTTTGRKRSSAGAGTGASSTRTAPAQITRSSSPISASPGHSGAAPGHSGAAPGHSGVAPGHSPTRSASPGHSAAAPGHSPTTSTSPGHSGAAPAHSGSSSSSSSTSTSRGNSATAPSRSTKPTGGDPVSNVATVPSAPLPSLPVDPAVTQGASATAPGHLK